MSKWSLKNPGWCTPTILVAILGLLSIIVMIVQLITYKKTQDDVIIKGLEKNHRRNIVVSIIVQLLWTLAIGGLLFYLCANGKVTAAWWVFGILYILPVVFLFVLLAGAFYVAGKASQN